MNNAPAAKPSQNRPTPLPNIPSLLQDGRRARFDHRSQLGGVPIGEPDAPVRLRVSDLRRLRSAVDSVVLLGKRDPDYPYGIVRPRRDRGPRVAAVGVPEQPWIVMEDRIP